MNDTQAIHAKLDHAAALLFARDIAVVDELWSEGFRLVGSEVDEIASSHDELVGLINYLFSLPFRLRWDWASRPVRVEGDFAWVFAQGQVEFVYDDRVERFAYRLVTIFRRDGDDWVWRLYSGSEPVPRRLP